MCVNYSTEWLSTCGRLTGKQQAFSYNEGSSTNSVVTIHVQMLQRQVMSQILESIDKNVHLRDLRLNRRLHWEIDIIILLLLYIYQTTCARWVIYGSVSVLQETKVDVLIFWWCGHSAWLDTTDPVFAMCFGVGLTAPLMLSKPCFA